MGKSFVHALNGALNSFQVRPQDIEVIQYFHVHPGKQGSPLSEGDQSTSQEIKSVLEAKAGKSIPVLIYAIVEKDGQLITFHIGQ